MTESFSEYQEFLAGLPPLGTGMVRKPPEILAAQARYEAARERCRAIIRDADIELDWLLHAVETVDRWLDAEVAQDYKDQPLAQDWARVCKITEEAGESVAELILATGQNPRKGTDPGARDRLLAELGDTAVTAIFAIQHFTKDPAATWSAVTKAVAKAYDRAPEQYR